MLKKKVLCTIVCLFFVSCAQKGDNYYLSFWNLFRASELNLATLQLDSLKSINPAFHHKDTTIAYMEQAFNVRAKYISDSIATKVQADSVARVNSINKEHGDSINSAKSNLLLAPIIRKLEKRAKLFCTVCGDNHFEKEDLSGFYVCCATTTSLDIYADSSNIKIDYTTILDGCKVQLILAAISELISTLEPHNTLQLFGLKKLLTESISNGHSEISYNSWSLSLETKETYAKDLQSNLHVLTCKLLKKLN